MKHLQLFTLFVSLTVISNAQSTIQTKEIKITYADGFEVFNICTSGCRTSFSDTKEYFWYTEFSNIKSTKGGFGGSLLHGNYKMYDEEGNLLRDKSYYLGLMDGNEKNWDSQGNIVAQYKYNKGECIYMKLRNDEKYWIEFNGPMLQVGTVRKVYTEYNNLISEETILADFKERVKTYYEYSGKIKEEYTTGFAGLGLMGSYTHYYENGKIEIQGQYYDGEYTEIRVGTWTWYDADGTIEIREQYKANVEYWDNGEIAVTGGHILDTEANIWHKTGEWIWYTEEGKLSYKSKYEWGREIPE